MDKKCNILIADDEKEIIKVLRLFLEKENLNVYEAYDGEMAHMLVQNYDIDLAIIDIMMPRMDGYELLKKIREEYQIPVMILSAKIQLDDKILGLDLGADDYITKPFEPLEVVARVRAHLRRNNNGSSNCTEQNILTFQELQLDVDCCQVKICDKVVDLTKIEFLLLEMFMQQPGRVFTKEQIYERGWGGIYAVDDNTIRVTISRLRDKIGEKHIKTIRGLGYRLEG